MNAALAPFWRSPARCYQVKILPDQMIAISNMKGGSEMPDEGFRKWLGVEYEVTEESHAVVGMPVREEMRNLRGVVQGGAVAALIDVGMATAASGGNYDTRLRPMVTLEMKINYLAPATGERLTCVSDVISAGSRTAEWR